MYVKEALWHWHLWPISKNFFQRNLHHYWCIASRFDKGYAARGVNYGEKSFMKFTPGRTDSFDQLGVLVDEPSLTEDIGSRIFQLQN